SDFRTTIDAIAALDTPATLGEGPSGFGRPHGRVLGSARMRQPLVTIVTPSYNQGKFIRSTIDSVLAQDYPVIEYIIIDGGSGDETASIAREYGDRLTFISER